ncbi:MAG: polyprenyl synthetase family protein, partial [Actinomycetota bacterium]
MSRYEPSLDELRALVDAELTRFLDRSVARLDDNRLLIDELRRVIAAGGKRLRPAFCYWGYRAAGADHNDQIVSAAASLELLHTFALVHDDIMDGAELRRGEPTVHALHGLSVGVLAG